MRIPTILVIGAGGQLGVELTLALRERYRSAQVIAADIKSEHPLIRGTGPFVALNALNKEDLRSVVRTRRVTDIYLLAAVLSSTGEKAPATAWQLNMQSLLNVLGMAEEESLERIFWPSSIAVYGPSAPKLNCPQETIFDPSTVYGISKLAGEHWCRYYHERYGVDVRSLRYPGLISWRNAPGGGTTDYAVEIFHEAINKGRYTCFLNPDTRLPMLYMPDAIRATIELMEADGSKLSTRMSYVIGGLDFTPAELAAAIQVDRPDFRIDYAPDFRQAIADSWPDSLDDSLARTNWGWKPATGLAQLSQDMLTQLTASFTTT